MGLRILIIDDELIVLSAISRSFSRDHEVTTCSDPIDGLTRALNQDFDGILVDMRMPEMNGVELVQKLLSARPELEGKAVLITGGDSRDSSDLPAPLIWKPLAREDVSRLVWWWEGQGEASSQKR